MNTTLSIEDLQDITVARMVVNNLERDIVTLRVLADRLQDELRSIAYDDDGAYSREGLGDFASWSDFHAEKAQAVSDSLMNLRRLVEFQESSISLRR